MRDHEKPTRFEFAEKGTLISHRFFSASSVSSVVKAFTLIKTACRHMPVQLGYNTVSMEEYLEFVRKIFSIWNKRQWMICAAGLALLAGLAVYYFLDASSTYGIGINSDSISYVRSARNLAEGQGLGRVSGSGEFKQMTHWPPLYSMVLAVFPMTGVDTYEGARWLGAGLLFLIIFLTGWTLFRATGSSFFSLLAAALLVFAPSQWETTLKLLSEPLFLVLALAGVLCLDRYFHTSTIRWLVTSGILIGLAFLTRYAGITLVAAGCLLLLMRADQALRARIKPFLIFGLAACTPALIWVIYNQLAAGSGTNRTLQYFPIPASDFADLLQTLSGWLRPFRTVADIGAGKILFGGGLAAASLAAIYLAPDRGRQAKPSVTGWFYLLFAPIYAVFVWLSRLYFDSMIHIYRERITFPFFLAVFIVIVWGAASLWRWLAARNRLAAAGWVLVLSFVWLSFFQGYRLQSLHDLKQTRTTSFGMARLRHEPPEVVKVYQQLPPADLIFSTNIELMYYLTEENALTLYEELSQADLQKITGYIGTQSTYFVIFNSNQTVEILQAFYPQIKVIYMDGDGAILKLN